MSQQSQKAGPSFADELLQISNHAVLAVNIFLGQCKDIGLFEGLAKYEKPQTCKQIADDLGLKER